MFTYPTCAGLGCAGDAQSIAEATRLHTTPLVAPAAAPMPGEPPQIAPPTAPPAAPLTAPMPAFWAARPALPCPGVAPAWLAIASHSATSLSARAEPTCWYFSLPYRTGLAGAHAENAAATSTSERIFMRCRYASAPNTQESRVVARASDAIEGRTRHGIAETTAGMARGAASCQGPAVPGGSDPT